MEISELQKEEEKGWDAHFSELEGHCGEDCGEDIKAGKLFCWESEEKKLR